MRSACVRRARALPGGRDGAGVAGHDHGVERTDIDAQFQRVGGDHGAQFAVAQLALDLAPLLGKIAAAVAANLLRRPVA